MDNKKINKKYIGLGCYISEMKIEKIYKIVCYICWGWICYILIYEKLSIDISYKKVSISFLKKKYKLVIKKFLIKL